MTENGKSTTALATTQGSEELLPTRQAAEAEAEIKAAMVLAAKFPRNEDKVFAALMRACQRPGFAEQVGYAYPRGGQKDCDHDWNEGACRRCYAALISGPSVYLAREAVRIWGNARSGVTILADGEETRLIEAYAYDLQTNYRSSFQDEFNKIIFRRDRGWIPADERELRELTNRRAAFIERNSILKLLPRDLIEDALDMAETTLANQAAKDPEGERKKIILGFGSLNVSPDALEAFLGHKLAVCSPKELIQLRAVWKSVEEGNSKWADYAGAASKQATSPAAGGKAAKGKKQADPPAQPPQPVQPPPMLAQQPLEYPMITPPQGRLFWAIANKNGWKDEDTIHAELKAKFGIEHVKAIPKAQLDAVISHFAKGPQPTR